MQTQAVGKYLRIAPRKLVPIARLVKNKKAVTALKELNFVNRKGAKIIAQVLASAIANAKNNFSLREDSLIIKKIEIGKGPSLKRWKAASKGRLHQILKRTSHIKVVLENSEARTTKAEDNVGKIREQKDEKELIKADKKGEE